MAQLMKCTDAYSASRTIKIVAAETTDFTVYVIEVSVGRFSWWVKHRYSEFLDMHEKLVTDCKLEKEIFPPKKLFGKMSDAFIAKRQAQLEIYLQTVLLHFYSASIPLPQVLTNFLDFPKYEIHGITELLAEYLYNRGDWYIQTNDMFTIQTLQLHGVHERLKLAEPTCESGDKKKDLGHVLDFITRVKNLKILGSRDPVWNSNIDMNQLAFDLTIFRNLEILHIVNVNVSMAAGVEIIKRTVKKLYVRHSITLLEEILLRDIAEVPVQGQGQGQGYLVPAWNLLKMADFSHNDISRIDESVKLMPKVESLSLSHNQLGDIDHLSSLYNLRILDLSHNQLKYLDALHTKLGNLKTLNLSGNQISSLQGLSKLYSLEALDLQSNEIAFVLEIHHIANLPCLEYLILTGNPITVIVDYRTKVFELMGERSGELYLDNMKPTQKERDTVAILQAIQKAREGRERAKRHVKRTATEVAITEPLLSLSSLPDSPPDVALTGAAHSDPFRQKVETIRAEVGESWLSLLNEMQQQQQQQDEQQQQQQEIEGGEEGPRTLSSRVPGSGEDAVCTTITPGLPALLPGIGDSSFTHFLHRYIGSLNVSSHIPGITGSPHGVKSERVIYIIWAVCLPYVKSRPYPACIVLTDERIHILRYDATSTTTAPLVTGVNTTTARLVAGTSINTASPLAGSSTNSTTLAPPVVGAGTIRSTWSPCLVHVYSMEVSNVQEIVVGYRQLHFRIEESFTGTQGTFAFVTTNPSKTLQFITFLKDASSISGDEVLMVQDFNDLSERRLLEVLSGNAPVSNENNAPVRNAPIAGGRNASLMSGKNAPGLNEIAHYIIVQVVVTDTLNYNCIYAACLSRDFLYLLEVNPVNFPSTTFQLVIEDANLQHYRLLQSFSLKNTVKDVHFCNDPVRMAPVTDTESLGQVISYGLTLTFENEAGGENEAGYENEASKFQCVFQSPEMRDLFLCQLMQLRRELSLRSNDDRDCTIDGQSTSSVNKSSFDAYELADEGAVSVDEFSDARSSLPREMTVSEYSKLENWHKPLAVTTSETITSQQQQQQSSPSCYPSLEFLQQLTDINQNIECVHTLSPSLQSLADLNGEAFFNYFHEKVAEIGLEGEELRHVMWTMVTPYPFPGLDIMTCVVLSSKTIYFISDRQLPCRSPRFDVTKTHRRNQSDSLLKDSKFHQSLHHTSGLIHLPGPNALVARCYGKVNLVDICNINVGMSDTFIRLTSDCPETTFVCLTRSETLTNSFLQQLTQVFATFSKATSPDQSSSDSEQDFYKLYTSKDVAKNKKLEFLYAKDDLFDLKYLIAEKLLIGMEAIEIYTYLPVYEIRCLDMVEKYENLKAKTLVICNSHVGFLDEDYVHYPVPDFARYPPRRPRHEVTDIRRLDFLKRVTVSDFTSSDMTLIFTDHVEAVDVDPSYDHYSADSSKDVLNPGEVKWSILIHSVVDKDKILNILSEKWSECHDGKDLSIQVNA